MARERKVFQLPLWKRGTLNLLWTASVVSFLILGLIGLVAWTHPSIGLAVLGGAALIFLAFDRVAMDYDAAVILTDEELQFRPGGLLLKRFVPPSSAYAPRTFTLDEWSFAWYERNLSRAGEADYWVWEVTATKRDEPTVEQKFRVLRDLHGIPELLQATSTVQ